MYHELIIKQITAHSKTSSGCKKHKKDIMLSFYIEGSEDAYGLFLTDDQCEILIDKMLRSLNRNVSDKIKKNS